MPALSQVEYLEKKLEEIDKKIQEKDSHDPELFELYFKRGKLYSEIELLKRVPAYDE